MDRAVLKWLYDVKLAIEEIDIHFDGHYNFIAYQKNVTLKRAVERDLEIIGEAINRIQRKNPSYLDDITDAKAIIGLRNLVIHAYDSISDENIWSIVIKHLPVLKSEISELIKTIEANLNE